MNPVSGPDNIMVWNRKSISYTLLAIVVLFLSVAQFNGIINGFDGRVGLQVGAAQGVLEGLPHWRVYQSRVLGPYLVHAVEGMTGLGFEQAYALMMFVWLVLFFSVLMAAAISLWKSCWVAVGIAASAAFLNTTLMQGEWLYTWDLIDLCIFTCLTWGILSNKPLKIIALIILVESFNREAATIIAGWLAVDALLVMRRGDVTAEQIRSAKRQMVVAVALVFVSRGTIEALRAILLVRETGPEIFNQVEPAGSYFQLQIWSNFANVEVAAPGVSNLVPVYKVMLIGIPIICVVGMCSARREVSRTSLLFLMLWASTVIFGVVCESRVWLAFVPYLVLAVPRLSIPAGVAHLLPAVKQEG